MSSFTVNLIFLIWSADCVISSANKATKFYVPVVILWTQDNAKLLQQLKLGFKRTINGNKYQSKVSIERQNHYSDLIDSSFQEEE